jgi:CRP-like cAMP-binding protein
MKYPTLFNNLAQWLNLSEVQWMDLEKLFTFKKVKKGEVFINPGENVLNFGFVLKGLFKLSYISHQNEENIKAFRHENQLISAYAEYIQNIPSRTQIMAIEESEIAVISFVEFERLISEKTDWLKLKLKITEQHFIIKDKREHDFLIKSAMERYEEFKSENPLLAERVPQYLIANYLGITPVALSRLLSQKNYQR